MLPIILAIVVAVLDQATKYLVSARMLEYEAIPVIPGFFSLEFVKNPGAAFGMLGGQRWLFVGISLIAVGAMFWYSRQREAKVGVVPWALGLLMGGAIGNLIDRALYGKVVDFLMFYHKGYVFPNFNVADIAITVGVGLFILHLIWTGETHKREGV